ASASMTPPIGYIQRCDGITHDAASSHANAFSAGREASGGDVTIKHCPGLGRVAENTDTDAGVTDGVTTRDEPSVAVFASGIEAGAAFVMTSRSEERRGGRGGRWRVGR